MTTLRAIMPYRLALPDAVAAAAQQRIAETGLIQAHQCSRTAAARLQARLAILAAWEAYRDGTQLSLRQAADAFARAYNRGELGLLHALRVAVPTLSRATLYRWLRQRRQEGIDRLAGGYGKRHRPSVWARRPEIAAYAVGVVADHPTIRAAHLREAIAARFPGQAPSRATVQRFLADYQASHQQTLAAMANPDAWKSRYMVAFGDAAGDVRRLNQRWEMDSTPADLLLEDGRYVLVGAIDVYSRRLSLLVAKTSKATAIAALLRRTLLAWGVPEELVTDNGQDYTSHHVTRVLAGLEIQHTRCPPFQPWAKPFIERAFRTFAHDLVELLPGYIGHNVADREAIRARQSFAERLFQRERAVEIRLTAAELQYFCDRWCEERYALRPHRGLHGATPAQRVATWHEPIRRITDPRALDILLAEAPGGNGLRAVQKKGIQVEGAWFIAPELAAFVGERVQVRYDPADVGRLYVFDARGQFVCVAECPERTGISRAEVAAKARALQRSRVQAERQALKAAARSVTMDDIVEAVLRDRAETATPAIAPATAPAIPHDTPALEAAAEAAAAEAQRPALPLAECPQPHAALHPPPPVSQSDPEDLEDLPDYFRRLYAQATWTPDEAAWMQRNRDTPWGRAALRAIAADVANRGEKSPYAARYRAEHGTSAEEHKHDISVVTHAYHPAAG
jgi:transposase InsO family protein